MPTSNESNVSKNCTSAAICLIIRSFTYYVRKSGHSFTLKLLA
jgi:hypothetical protein